MLPHEAQALMAKILFIVFATFILCMRPGNTMQTEDLPSLTSQSTTYKFQKN